jgi:hypothetical protein
VLTYLRATAFAVAFLLVPATPALAQSGKAAPKSDKVASGDVRVTTVVSTDAEVRIIREYYVARGVKPKPLPPGIARNLVRGRPVPSGLMRTRLPDDLVTRLPRREGHQWAVANNVVLLIDSRGIVRDILRDVF